MILLVRAISALLVLGALFLGYHNFVVELHGFNFFLAIFVSLVAAIAFVRAPQIGLRLQAHSDAHTAEEELVAATRAGKNAAAVKDTRVITRIPRTP